MATTVTFLRGDRVTCIRCEDIVPGLIVVRLEELPYCRSCAQDVMQNEIVEMRRELAS